MIEDALVFALGALTASLLALAILPLFTRRARRLARVAAEARLPRSLAELAAARDAIRAEYAARTARVEGELDRLRDRVTADRVSRSREQQDLKAARAEAADLRRAGLDMQERIDELREEVRRREEAVARLSGDLREAERRLSDRERQLSDAEERLLEAERLATDMKLALVAVDARQTPLIEASVPVPAAPRSVRPVSPQAVFPDTADAGLSDPADEAIEFGEPPMTPLDDDEAQRGAIPLGETPKVIRLGTMSEPLPPAARVAVEAALVPTDSFDFAAPRSGDAVAGSATEDFENQARRVDELAARLRSLRTRNASVRGRLVLHKGEGVDETGDPAPQKASDRSPA